MCGQSVRFIVCQQRLQARRGDEQDLVAAVLDVIKQTKCSRYFKKTVTDQST